MLCQLNDDLRNAFDSCFAYRLDVSFRDNRANLYLSVLCQLDDDLWNVFDSCFAYGLDT